MTWLALAGVAIAFGGATALLPGSDGGGQLTGVAGLVLPIAPPAGMQEGAADIAADGSPPATAALLEDGEFGPLPRFAADGRRPFHAYARPFNLDEQRPRIAILVIGLGLQADPTAAAIRLPGPISLQFSAYASELPELADRARQAGHEVLLDLPMEPPDYPASDPGPHTLLAGNASEENLERLDWLLARTTGYLGLAGSGARFATSAAAPVIMAVLARRGLAMIEIGADHLAAAALAAGLPYASAPPALDEDPSTPAIDYALAGLEAEARRTGSALGVVQSYPVSLERLRLWAITLESKGLVLAPVSALLMARSGLAAGSAGHGQAGDRSQG